MCVRTSVDDGHQLSPKRILVIGSGAVGLFLAKRLRDHGLPVLLVESGEETLGGFPPNSFESVGRRHDGVRIGRSRSLGGTSNLWGGQLVEFEPHDVNGRAWLEGSAWPLAFEELRRHYPSSFESLGVPSQFHDDRKVWEGVVGSTPGVSGDVEVFLTRWMNSPSLADLFAKQIRSDRDLAVLTGHTATGFQYDGPRVASVVVKDRDGREHRIPAKQVVIACGTIESTRLLLAAAHENPSLCPWSGNDNVGRYFQDHLGGRVASVIPSDRSALMRTFCTIRWKGQKFQPKVRFRSEGALVPGRLGVHGMVMFESSVSEHLQYLKQFLKAAVYSRRLGGIGDLWSHGIASARYLPPLMLTYLRDHRVFVPGDSRIAINVQAEQFPLRDSRITIDPARRDRFGLPAAVVDWRVDGREVKVLRDFVAACDAAFRAAGIGQVRPEAALAAGDPSFLDTLRDTNHPAGGARMGRSREDGVVDSDLRVFGTSNLFVAGAAVFPTSSAANVTFTAMALASRLAEHLSGGSIHAASTR